MGTQDEATFGLIPLVSRGWERKGSKPVTIVNQKNEYTNVFAARSKKSFVFSFSKRKKQADFIRFCRRLLKRWNKVFLFVDGAPCHKGAKIRQFCEEHRKVFRLERFPPYTPELNPTEQCWKPARKALSNRLLKTMPAAKYHLRKTFDEKNSLPKMFDYL